MTYHIIYKTTCIITGRWYIGMHSTSDLNDGYMGSGYIVQASIKKYGRDNHKVEILEYLSSRQALIIREKELVTNNIIADPMCMNLLEGGHGGWSETARLLGKIAQKKRFEEDEDFRLAFIDAAKINGTMVSVESRVKCSTALKAKYQDASFKEHQRIGQAKANAASWTPEARERRLQNKLKRKEMVEMNQLNAIKVNHG